jgi:mutator protein MutT
MFWDKQEHAAGVAMSFRAAGCFCLLDEKVLLMQRNPHKSYGLHWAIPTGKIEHGETPRNCMIRELQEELNIEVNSSELELIGDFIVEVERLAYQYVTFVLHLNKEPTIIPNPAEIHRIEWKPINRIQKRKVVPYFYNTVNALVEWETNQSAQVAMFPESEATCVDRKRLRSYRTRRVRLPDKNITQIGTTRSSVGTHIVR